MDPPLKNLEKKTSKKSLGVEFPDFSLVRTNGLMAIMACTSPNYYKQKYFIHSLSFQFILL